MRRTLAPDVTEHLEHAQKVVVGKAKDPIGGPRFILVQQIVVAVDLVTKLCARRALAGLEQVVAELALATALRFIRPTEAIFINLQEPAIDRHEYEGRRI